MGMNDHHKHGYVQRPQRLTSRTAPRAYTLHRLPHQSQGPTCLRCDLVRLQRRTGAISVRWGMARLSVGGACIDEGYAQTTSSRSCEGECSARTHGVLACTKGAIAHLPCAPRCRRAAVCSCRPPPRPSAAVVPVHLWWGT